VREEKKRNCSVTVRLVHPDHVPVPARPNCEKVGKLLIGATNYSNTSTTTRARHYIAAAGPVASLLHLHPLTTPRHRATILFNDGSKIKIRGGRACSYFKRSNLKKNVSFGLEQHRDPMCTVQYINRASE
jgi:hypothetical protein